MKLILQIQSCNNKIYLTSYMSGEASDKWSDNSKKNSNR